MAKMKVSKTRKSKIPAPVATDPFMRGRELVKNAPDYSFVDFTQAAMFAARRDGLSVRKVKEYMKTMVTDHILRELGYG